MAPAPKMVRTKTPGIYRRGGRYVVVFYDAEGRQRKESARNYDGAKKLKNKRETEVAGGTYAPTGKLTLHAYGLEWIDNYRGRRKGIRQRTKDEYRRDLEAYAFRFFGPSKRLSAVTTRDADAFISWLLSPAEQGQQLSSRTVKRILVPLNLCFAAALRHGLVATNPFDSAVVPVPDTIDDDEEQLKVMTPEQLREFLRRVDPAWRLFFEVLASTGARWSEAIAWRRRDLDLERGCLNVRQTLYEGEAQPPKTRYSRRSIPLCRRLLGELEKLVEGLERDELIFRASNGSPLRYENVWRRQLKPAAKSAGVPWIGFHTFRHTAASLLFEGGANVVRVQRFLGHSSPAFTLSTYIHLLDEDLGEGLDL